MQAKNKDGTYGPLIAFDPSKIQELLTEDQVSHVEVFKGTPQEIQRRKLLQEPVLRTRKEAVRRTGRRGQ